MSEYSPQYRPANDRPRGDDHRPDDSGHYPSTARETVDSHALRIKVEEGPANKIVWGIVLYLIGSAFFGLYITSLETSYDGDLEGNAGLVVAAVLSIITGTIFFLLGLHRILVNLNAMALRVSANMDYRK